MFYAAAEPPSFFTPFDVVIFDNTSAYPTESPRKQPQNEPQTAPTTAPSTANEMTDVILALFDDAIAQVPSSEVANGGKNSGNSSFGLLSKINNLVNGALALNSDQWESLFSFLPGLMQR